MAYFFRFVFLGFLSSCLVCMPVLAASGAERFAGPRVVYNGAGVATVVPSVFSMLKDVPSWSATSVGSGAVAVVENFKGAVGPVSEVAMTVSRTLPAAAVFKTAARLLPVVGQAAAAYQVYDLVRCYSFSGGFECDPGKEKENVTRYQIACGYAGCPHIASTEAEVCAIRAAGYIGYLNQTGAGTYQYQGGGYGAQAVMGGNHQCYTNYQQRLITNPGNPGPWTNQQVWIPVTSTTVLDCTSASQTEAAARHGNPVGGDGKCPTGVFTPTPIDDLPSKVISLPSAWSKAPDVVKEAPGKDIDFTPDLGPAQVNGPSSVNGPASSGATGTGTGNPTEVTNTTVRYDITYQGDQYRYTETTVTTTTNNTTNQTTVNTTTKEAPEIKTCGLPGTPACKIDETGTPTWTDPTTVSDKADQLLQEDQQKRDQAANSVQTPSFGWFNAPPMADCYAFDLPNSMGQIDPCSGAETVRTLMAYLWPLFGGFWCFGVIRRTVTGG